MTTIPGSICFLSFSSLSLCIYLSAFFLAVVYKNYRKHLKVDCRHVVLNIVYFAFKVGYYFILFQAFISSILFISSFRP